MVGLLIPEQYRNKDTNSGQDLQNALSIPETLTDTENIRRKRSLERDPLSGCGMIQIDSAGMEKLPAGQH